MRFLACGGLALALAACDSYFHVNTAWQEELKLSGGNVVVLSRSYVRGADEWLRPGRGGIQESTTSGELPGIGRVEFHWKGHETPVAFDVIEGIPWVVLPIAGLNSCEKYGNPAESVIALARRDGRWTHVSFRDAPQTLRANVLRGGPFSLGMVTLKDKKALDPLIQDLELRAAFIPQHTKWEHACHNTNPPRSAEHERVRAELAALPTRRLVALVVAAESDENRLAQSADDEIRAVRAGPVDSRGCAALVAGVEAVHGSWREGTAIHRGTSGYLVRLSAPDGTMRAFHIPVEGRALRRILCSEQRISALLGSARRPPFQVLSYDREGRLREVREYAVDDPAVAEAAHYGAITEATDRGHTFEVTALLLAQRDSPDASWRARQRVEFVLAKD
ncbi:MAG: hypothetical protein ACREUS_05250 [Burkholderiales bacterium]